MPFQADEWGRDPSVRRMREIFSSMEKAQGELLGRIAIFPFDPRLRPVRRKALESFERVWALSARKGVVLGEEEVTSLYLLCLVDGLVSEGIHVPPKLLTTNERLNDLFKQGLS